MSKKLSGKALAAFEKSRDLNAELRAYLEETKRAGKPLWARKTDFIPQPDGTILRRITRSDGTVEKEQIIPAGRLSIAAARAGTGLSQGEFAMAMGVSVRTLQDWEQGRREPSGAAQTLLKIAAKHPRVLREAVNG
ncbi:MAG: helix-turn-helix domain-containing protein [Nevskia sp.]|nr:helix-turn-helix domain-containing protein [Nevskia sp.]